MILRPGPYACGEWEWGGYPAWLLKDHNIVVRSSDPRFMDPARRWLMRLGQELAPLQIGNGGPIIAVQLENEYGNVHFVCLHHRPSIGLASTSQPYISLPLDRVDRQICERNPAVP